MESIRNSNTFGSEVIKMTLKDYFNAIPEASAPRTDFLKHISEICNVPFTTARSWFVYGIKPRDPKTIDILSKETGIDPEDMW